jgi:tetratricopeptide (TPR) repeat protein
MKGQVPEAAGFQGRALRLAQAAGLKTVEAECQFYGAELDRLQQRFKEAREGYGRVLDLLPEGVTPEVRINAQAALAECLLRRPRPDLKEGAKQLGELPASLADTPYVHRAKAWSAFSAGKRDLALQEVTRALADVRRQAPEIRGELEAMRAQFLGSGNRDKAN